MSFRGPKALRDSLSCRETRLHSPENRWKSPQFRNSSPQTGPEKMSRRTPKPSFVAFFSRGAWAVRFQRLHQANGTRSLTARTRALSRFLQGPGVSQPQRLLEQFHFEAAAHRLVRRDRPCTAVSYSPIYPCQKGKAQRAEIFQ